MNALWLSSFNVCRFAQFFLCPLFDESCKDREVNAVDSEHEKNLMNDAWRLFQLEKATGNPKHPFSKFGTGRKNSGALPVKISGCVMLGSPKQGSQPPLLPGLSADGGSFVFDTGRLNKCSRVYLHGQSGLDFICYLNIDILCTFFCLCTTLLYAKPHFLLFFWCFTPYYLKTTGV